MTEIAVTLEDMLESKEDRAFCQSELIDKYKCPLISFTVVMPGKVKQNKMTEKIFQKGTSAIEAALEGYCVKYKTYRNKKTGPEAFYCVDISAEELKKLMTEVEDRERIGRLYDIDVINVDKIPVSRSDFGMPERKCLICGSPAHACSRSRKHTTEELLCEIERVLSDE
ncbi:MAG: citrate lyase holo-[acyl-carrier protein] synthase [Ruminococcaceae bacterium]|nr:citrate lyase holo-[acyl-carrier protein] synthase [Oscillospiraceae bacterium]